MLRLFRLATLTWILGAWPAELLALEPARIFSDHMVLQQGVNVPLWGKADPGAEVSIRFDGQVVTTRVADDGSWRLELSPLAASSEGRDLRLQSGDHSVVFQDVLVGEVWFAGGQSNMDQKMGVCAKQLSEVQALVASADYPEIRFRKISDRNSPIPMQELSGGQWSVCNSKAVVGFSAVAFVFARRLHEELGVPVGMIDCAWGGTPIEPYIPMDAFVDHPTLVALASMAQEKDFEGIRNLPGGTYVRSDAWLAGAIFNGRIAPVASYGIRGFLWYQGESNSGKGEDPREYAHKMRALIRGWRAAWGRSDLPFYYVQLPQWNSYAWTYLREEQQRALDVVHTGMAVTIDLDNGNNIHPPNKIDVGERLALWPLAKVYHHPVSFSGPLFRDCRVQGDTVEVHFDHVGDGFMVGQAGVGKVSEVKDGLLHGFEIAGADGLWHEATASIAQQRLLVSSQQVTNPVAVRYACHPEAIAGRPWNLYNRAGLPASPFCSNWKLMPYDPTLNPPNAN